MSRPGSFVALEIAVIEYYPSPTVRPSVCLSAENNATSNVRIFMKIPYSGLFHISILFKSDSIRKHFMWRPAVSRYNWDRLWYLWGTNWGLRNFWLSINSMTLPWVHSISHITKRARNRITLQIRTTLQDRSITDEKKGRGTHGGDVSRCTSSPAQAKPVLSLWCDGQILTAHRSCP
jgi:hypothetical protein